MSPAAVPPRSSTNGKLVQGPSAASPILLRGSKIAFDAWLDAIRNAKAEVVVEMYWFASDRTGRTFAQALAERAKAGVSVYVLYDSVGSIGTDRSMFHTLELSGARVREYNPIAPWRKRFQWSRISSRDHRKLLVVDEQRAFVAGINLADPPAPREYGGKGWRDDAVEVDGTPAANLRELFFDAWATAGGQRPLRDARPLRSVPGPSEAVVLGQSDLKREIRRAYLTKLKGAQREVFVANAYFAPDLRVRRALKRAARRGVDVRIMVPDKSDVPLFSIASDAGYGGLLRAGVGIYKFHGSLLHSKTAVIDGWGTVGSYNFDYRSFLTNLEANVASKDPAFVTALRESFLDDLKSSTEVTLQEWLHRPRLEQALGWVFYRLRRFL